MDRLLTRLREIGDLRAAASLLSWDEHVNMPPGGAEARGQQLATLSRLAHERSVDQGLRSDLEAAEGEGAVDEQERDLLAVARRDLERAQRVPPSFADEAARHASAAFQAWQQAMAQDDFSLVTDHLQRGVALSLRYAGYFPEFEHPADALIDQEDDGASVATLRPLFDSLRAELVPMVEAVAASPRPPSLPPGPYPAAQQLATALEFATAFGYDLQRGRQDLSPHPFAMRIAHGDVRITTRLRETELTEGLLSTLHETGHALYEQGVDPTLDGTPMASGVSAGVHESQSRLWENQVGRSRAFWSYALPRLQQAFPTLQGVSVDQAYRAVNRVGRSLIRTESDELTYNLHVIIRFDLESELLQGSLAVRDLPEAWDARYQADLGLRPSKLSEGVLQDVHWYAGLVGGTFQGYTLGNVLSAQFFAAAEAELGDQTAAIEQGEFGPLHDWLRHNVYRHGRLKRVPELIRLATGRDLEIEPYTRYLRAKFSRLYPEAGLRSSV